MKQTEKLFISVLLSSAVVFLINCTRAQQTDVAAEGNESLLRCYIEEMNKGNESFLDEYFAADYTYHGPAGDLDAEGFKALHHMFLSAFPDTRASVEDMIAAGDKVATRYKIHGTHRGELQGISPTGKEITITGIIISQVADGRVVEEWEAFDQLLLMQQLGVIPERRQAS